MPFFFTMPISSTRPMIATTLKSWRKRINARKAPTPADGNVDRIVIGWTKLSYKTPSTMYTVTSAARISKGSLASELVNDAAVPWNPACRLGGRCMSFCTLSTAVMASPRAAFGPRLKDTVIAGNCPWWLMESASVVFSKCEKALSGTALLKVELGAPAEFAPLLDVDDALGESAFAGGARVFADGVYSAEAVSALDPAEDDPEDANEVEAPAPVAPEDAFDWM